MYSRLLDDTFIFFKDETRLKTTVIRVEPIDHKQYNAYLVSQIEKFAL